MIEITLFPGRTSTRGQRVSLSKWEDLYTVAGWPDDNRPKDMMPGWSAATYIGDVRLLANVERVCAVVLDYDKGDVNVEKLTRTWCGGRGLIHETDSSTSSAPRFRVVLELSRPVTAAEYNVIHRAVSGVANGEGHTIDPNAADASRFWYACRGRLWHETAIILNSSPIDVEVVLLKCPPPVDDSIEGDLVSLEPQDLWGRWGRIEAFMRKTRHAVAGEGGHATTYGLAIALTRGFLCTEQEALEFMLPWNERCSPPWSEKELKYKIRSAVTRSRKPWGYLLRRSRP